MKKFKKLVFMCLVAGSVALFTGCGASQEKTENTATETTKDSPKETGKEEAEGTTEQTESKKIVIEDQLGKTIELDGVPDKVVTTIMPFPYIYYAVVGNSDNLIGCNPSSITAYETVH